MNFRRGVQMLTFKLAEEIVYQTMKRLHYNINIISTDGVILASGDKKRVDLIHEGAKVVAKTAQPLMIDESNIHSYPNTKPGINMPITYQGEIVGVVGITGDPNQLKEIAELVQLTTEIMTHQALTESKSEWQRKNEDFVFKSLVDGMPIENSLKNHIQKLSFDLKPPFQILLLSVDEEENSNRLSFYLEDLFFKLPAFYGHLQLNEYYILLSGMQEDQADNLINQLGQKKHKLPSIQIGVGSIVQNLTQLPLAFHSAKTALQYAKKSGLVTFFEDIELYSLFKDSEGEEVLHFVNRVLSKLSYKLLTTLQTFFESNLQLNQCAQKLEIHRHTLTYRLHKIKQLTGYDPQFFEDAVVLKMAISLRN